MGRAERHGMRGACVKQHHLWPAHEVDGTTRGAGEETGNPMLSNPEGLPYALTYMSLDKTVPTN